MTAPLATSPSPSNVMLGRGKIYADLLAYSNGVWSKTGEIDLGNCTAFSVSPKASVKEKYESMDKNSNLYARAAIQQTHTVKITGDEFSLFNVANMLMGSQGSVSVTGSSVTGEALTSAPKLGAYYATKYRNISAVTLHDGASAKTVGTDYTIDAASGRIYIVPTGTILTTDTLTVDYTYSTYALNFVEGGTNAQVDLYVRFKGNPVKGPTFEAEFWHVMFTPSGDMGFIADDYGNWSLEGMCLIDNNISPDGSLYRILQTA